MDATRSSDPVEHGAARATRPQVWLRPKTVVLTADGQWVRSTYSGGAPVRVKRNVLERFIALRSAADVRRFVSDYGELGINAEGQRSTLIATAPMTMLDHPGVPPGVPVRIIIMPPWCDERVSYYLSYSAQMNAALRLAADRGVPGDEDLVQAYCPVEKRNTTRTKAVRRQLAADFLNWWLLSGKVAPHVTWPPSATVPRLEWPAGVWGALGTQLLDRLQRPMPADTEAQCANPECQRVFRYGGRKPRADRKQWCPTCRLQGVRSKLAMRARAAMSEAQRADTRG